MKDLTKGNPRKLIVMFALPIFLGNVFQLLYSLMDTRIVGEILGQEALAAVGATNSINTLIVGFLIGLTNGFAIIVARNFGEGNERQLKSTVATSLYLGIITAIIFTVFSIAFLKPLLEGLNTPEEVIEQSYHYISVIFGGMTITMLYNICASILRAIGDTVAPLVFLILSTVLNVFLDYFLIKNCGMGVEGAAIATVISQAVSVVFCVWYIFLRYPILRLTKEEFRWDKNLVKQLYQSGLSMGLMMSLVSLGTVALQGAINTFGTKTIVAHTAARKITELFMIVFSVLGTTMATYCGQNFGAKEIARIKYGIRSAIYSSWIWCAGVIVVTYYFAPTLIYLVTGIREKEIIRIASLYLRIDTLFYFVPAMISILRNAMQGIGDFKTPIVSSTIEFVGKVLVVLLITPKLAYMGIILAEPIVWIFMVIPLILKMKNNPVLHEANI